MRLAQTGAEVVGIDFSEECINIARNYTPQCRFEVIDFRNLDDRFGKFDGVFACASLIHIKPEELPGVLNNIRQVLKDNGYVAIIILDGEGISEKWSLLEVDGKKLNRTVYLYKKEVIEIAAEKVGFKFVKEGFLDNKLTQYGWKNYIYKVKDK